MNSRVSPALRPAMPVLLLGPLLSTAVGCSEYAYTSKTTKDVFQQRRKNTVDVLMVVDNSCSMFEEQDKLAANFESFIDAFEGIEVDWQIGVVTTDMMTEGHQGALRGGDDELILSSPDGRVIDRVSYDSTWSIPPGMAMQLSSGALDGTDNDFPENWCVSDDTYGDGDKGSPGIENAACTMAGPPPPSTDTGASDSGAPDSGTADSGAPDSGTADSGSTDTGGDGGGDDGGGSGGDDGGGSGGDDGGSTTADVTAGSVIFTEFMADPTAVVDSLGEWVELANLTTDDIDLSGFVLSDLGRNSALIPEGTIIPAGGYLVVGRSIDTTLNGGAEVQVAVPEGFTLNNDIRVLNTSTSEPEEIFSEMVAVGVDGSGIEMGLASARAALSEPLLSTTNAGFLRDDANLSIIFISDENDFSADTTSEYYLHFGSLKSDAAYRDHGILNFSAVVGRDVPPAADAPACESTNGVATYGARYIDLATRTDGALESICDEDFSPIASELGLLVSGLELEFVLSLPCDETTLEVSLYADETDEAPIDTLELGVDYDFHIANNSITFGPGQVPPSETWIVAEYRVLARSTDRDEEAGTE